MSSKKPIIPSNHLNNIEIFNKDLLRLHEGRKDDNDFLVREVHAILDEKLLDIKRNFDSVLELTRHDQTLKTPANTYDLVRSSLSMHWVNDVVGLMNQIKISLKDDGLFIANFFGGECLKELKFAFSRADENTISPRVSPFITAESAAYILQNTGFSLPVVDVDKIEVSYENSFALMQHLRKIGETNSLFKQRKNFTTRSFMNRVNEIYAENFSDDEGRITATFEVITMTGWKPHESQQKPLRPGQSQSRLKDVL